MTKLPSKKTIANQKCFYFFIGTEAELIKVMPVIKEFQAQKILFRIIASGQNNIQKSRLLQILKIRTLDMILSDDKIHQSSLGLFFWFIKTFVIGCFKMRRTSHNSKNVMIVHGVTVSTVMGTLIGKLFGFQVAHLEAGLRSFNFLHPFPEEIDRVIVSQFADIHFCPNQWSLNNLSNKSGTK